VAAVKIRWTRLALEDVERAREYIAERNPSAAHSVIARIESALKTLAAYPEIGRRGRVQGTRELVVPETPLIIAYLVSKNAVEILAVIHGTQRWPDSF
jgi:toxin ParE1/3/4